MLPRFPVYVRNSLLVRPSPPLGCKSSPARSWVRALMGETGIKPSIDPKSKPNVAKMQATLSSSSADGWEKCWEEGLTPWDLGQPTPIVVRLLQTGEFPKGRILIPGCGRGYDVLAIAGQERYVVGLDISQSAIEKAKELFSSSGTSECFNFVQADFFTWRPEELFDVIFDYTSTWAIRIQDLLKQDGELITLMFPISEHVGGPPYKVSVADYEEVLHPVGFEAVSVVDNEHAIEPRKGREKLGRWKKSLQRSPL